MNPCQFVLPMYSAPFIKCPCDPLNSLACLRGWSCDNRDPPPHPQSRGVGMITTLLGGLLGGLDVIQVTEVPVCLSVSFFFFAFLSVLLLVYRRSKGKDVFQVRNTRHFFSYIKQARNFSEHECNYSLV